MSLSNGQDCAAAYQVGDRLFTGIQFVGAQTCCALCPRQFQLVPTRHTEDLHHYRQSVPGSVYFVTFCTQDRARGLTELPLAVALNEIVIASDNLKDTTTLAFTIMPDHCHWLFVLGSRLSLGRLLARQKAYTKAALSKPAISWQRDFLNTG